MAASRVANNIAVGFEWTLFSHGFVFWEYPGPEHLPPADEAGQRAVFQALGRVRVMARTVCAPVGSPALRSRVSPQAGAVQAW